MKILDLKINWYHGFANKPAIYLLVEDKPDPREMRYEHHSGLYFAEKDGYALFFSYERPGEGYGGSRFYITLKDGTEKTLIGPWSSRASVMNAYFEPHVTEVGITESRKLFDGRGGVWTAGNVSVELLREALERLRPQAVLVENHDWRGEIRYIIQCADGRERPTKEEADEWGDFYPNR
jgi:hypothetical protein